MERITILEAPKGKLTKRFKLAKGASAPTVTPYDDVLYFQKKSAKVSGIQDLYKTLSKLAGHPNACVIRGAVRPQEVILKAEAERKKRLDEGSTREEDQKAILVKGKDAIQFRRCKAVFEDAPQSWVAFDVDGFEATFDGPDEFRDAAQEYIDTILGGPFRDADYVIQLTSSHGVKPGLRCRLWFWLDDAIYSGHWYAWAKRLNEKHDDSVVDPAVFRPVQVHYTAAPIFEGMDDPLSERVVFVDGSLGGPVATDELDFPEYDPVTAAAEDIEGDGDDARERKGLVGAFNRHMPISALVEEHLFEHFTLEGGSRVTWLNSDSGSPGGCRIVDNDTKLFNSHASNPHPTEVANAFELVQTYMFDGDMRDTDKWIRKNFPDVAKEAEEQRLAEASDEFEGDEDLEDWMVDMNRRFAIMPTSRGTVVLQEEGAGSDIRRTYLNWQAFNHKMANQTVEVPLGKKYQEISVGEAWLKHPRRRTFDRTEYVIQPRPGEVSKNALNLWVPPEWMGKEVPAVDDEDVAPWLNLVKDLMPEPDAHHYFLQRVISLVQTPSVKRTSAVILQGGQGIGKDTVLKPIRYLVGPSNARIVDTSTVCSQFNGWMRGSRVCLLKEIDLSSRRDVMDKVKDYITGETVSINEKYQAEIEITNYVEFFGSTNHDNALVLEDDDRRYWFYATKFTAQEFYDRHSGIHDWIADKENMLKLVGWLQAQTLDVPLVSGTPPMTEGKQMAYELSKPVHAAIMDDLIEQNDPCASGSIINLSDLRDTIQRKMPNKGYIRPQMVSKLLADRGYIRKGQVRVPNSSQERVTLWVERGTIPAQLNGAELYSAYEGQRARALQTSAAKDFMEN